jgi:hypothetical protein
MPVHAALVSGPVGPDTIDLPGEPSRLREAVQGLRDVTRQVETVSQQLQQADPPQGGRGRTVLALSRGAQRAGTALEADARQLGELADSIESAADALAQGQDGLDGPRQRWRAARQGIRQASQDAKGGPQEPGALIRRIDAEPAERLKDIRLAIRAGRMLPEEERNDSNNGFERDWTQHLESVRESLTAGRRAADRLRQVDDDSAADIRQALRGR